jgi:ABC-type transport system involved in multi-copper enzyme maturation permease subunit
MDGVLRISVIGRHSRRERRRSGLEGNIMKFLAILKDSLREAIDCKVLYVMLGLSCLVVLVVASMSFKPLPAETMMRNLVDGDAASFVHMMRGELQEDDEDRRQRPTRVAGRFHLEGLRVVKGDADSPDSDYVLTVSMRAASEEQAIQIQFAPDVTIAKLRQQFAVVEKLNLLKVPHVRLLAEHSKKDNDGPTLYFEVETEPTDATRRLWPFEPSLFFGAIPLGGNVPLGVQLFLIASVVLSIGSWVTILVSIIITAFFIPNMLRKGTVDLMLVKPIRRSAILLFKYFGGLTFIFLNTTLAVVGIWLALGLRSGVWANSFLLMICIITFYFATLYGVSTLFGVVTRSAIVAILMTCGAWFLFFLVGTVNQVFEQRRQTEESRKLPPDKRWGDSTFAAVVKAVHKVTPRTSDLNQLANRILLSDFLTGELKNAVELQQTSLTWKESFAVSGIFLVLMLGLACWWFATKDY